METFKERLKTLFNIAVVAVLVFGYIYFCCWIALTLINWTQ